MNNPTVELRNAALDLGKHLRSQGMAFMSVSALPDCVKVSVPRDWRGIRFLSFDNFKGKIELFEAPDRGPWPVKWSER